MLCHTKCILSMGYMKRGMVGKNKVYYGADRERKWRTALKTTNQST